MSLDGRFVEQARRDLTALLAAYPELAEDDVLRQDMIEAETGALELIDKLVDVEREAKAMEGAVLAILDRLVGRKERFENRSIALRKYIKQIMEAANLKKVERPAATVSISAGRPKVVITDESLLPDRLFRIKREPNKTAIAAEIEEHGDVGGATLSNPEPVLRIS
jgi:hypothetical protein